jgi:hypothetical protein
LAVTESEHPASATTRHLVQNDAPMAVKTFLMALFRDGGGHG